MSTTNVLLTVHILTEYYQHHPYSNVFIPELRVNTNIQDGQKLSEESETLVPVFL